MQSEFNAKAEKIVNQDEFTEKKRQLESKQFTWKDYLFDAFVDAPTKFVLMVRSGFSQGFDQMRGKPKPEGDYYFDSLTNDIRGSTYFDRATLEGDLAYFKVHGLSAKFQEKSASIAREAFDQCRDFSAMVQTGQFKKYGI